MRDSAREGAQSGAVALIRLQRLGRTGRRPGTLRNCLFLTTSDDGFLRAAGLLDLWARGYVEPIEPPATPYHLFAQQIMALAMQTGGLVRQDWPSWIGSVPCFAALGEAAERILDHMLTTGVLHEDQGKMWFGAEGEKEFGHKNFLELFSVFTSPPLFTVLHGRTELGLVHESSFLGAGKDGSSVLLLGGRSWAVTSLDWRNRCAHVAPAPAGGKSRWCGGSRSMHFEHARAIRRVLASGDLAGLPSQRAKDALAQLRSEMAWVDDHSTAVVRDASGESRWWTFAGVRTNAMLAAAMGDLVASPQVKDNLALPLREPVRAEDIQQRLRQVEVAMVLPPVAAQVIDELKFGSCVPQDLAVAMLGRRAAEPQALQAVVADPVRSVSV